jgi:biopolymer transport protein ExbD
VVLGFYLNPIIMKRSIVELNAGSMADIAFLLLVFFLLVTAIPKLNPGILAGLPPVDMHDEPIPVLDKNVLEIEILTNGSILVEKRPATMYGLQQAVHRFYTNSGIEHEAPSWPHFPSRQSWTLASIEESDDLPEGQALQMKSNLEQLGSCRLMPSSAVVYLSTDDGSSYDAYIAVLDEVEFILNSLRDSIAVKNFGVNVEELRKSERVAEINCLKSILPKRLLENEFGQ